MSDNFGPIYAKLDDPLTGPYDFEYQTVNLGNSGISHYDDTYMHKREINPQSISACSQNAPTFVATSLLPKPTITGSQDSIPQPIKAIPSKKSYGDFLPSGFYTADSLNYTYISDFNIGLTDNKPIPEHKWENVLNPNPSISLPQVPDPKSKEFMYAKIYSSNFDDVIIQRMIKIHKDTLDWSIISKRPMSEKFINLFKDNINFNVLVQNPIIFDNNYALLIKFQKLFDMSEVCKNIQIRDGFFELFFNQIIWSSIVLNKSFTEEMIIRYSHKIDWSLVGLRENLSAQFVRDHMSKLNLSDERVEEIFKELPTTLNLMYYYDLLTDKEKIPKKVISPWSLGTNEQPKNGRPKDNETKVSDNVINDPKNDQIISKIDDLLQKFQKETDINPIIKEIQEITKTLSNEDIQNILLKTNNIFKQFKTISKDTTPEIIEEQIMKFGKLQKQRYLIKKLKI